MNSGLGDLSEVVRKRVEKASPTGSRCLIENCSNERAVQFCHVATRTCTPEILSTLEWHWNMRRKSLNLDSRYNVMFLGASLRQLYDQHCWALLPDATIIDQYYKSLYLDYGSMRADRYTFPHIPNGIFDYRLLPLRKMESFGITRQQDTGPPELSSFVHHIYPFDRLPVLRSHVHPRFAILELGRKVRGFREIFKTYKGSPVEATLHQICVLHAAWADIVPGLSDNENASYMCDVDCDDSSIGASVPERIREDRSSTSKQTRHYRAPKLKRSRSHSLIRRLTKRGRPHGTWLSRRSLTEHEKQVGKYYWTAEGLSDWRQDLES